MGIKWMILLIPFVVLAQKPKLLLLEEYKDQNISGWVMSEKLDGIRAYWDGKHLITRAGKAIQAPRWFTQRHIPKQPTTHRHAHHFQISNTDQTRQAKVSRVFES